MADKIMFQSTMTKFNVNVKKENIYTCIGLQLVEDSSVRGFPPQFHSVDLGVFDHMASNDVFDKINIPFNDYNIKYDVTFGDTTFTAKIENIAACIKHTKDGTPYTVYNINLVKEIDKDVDTKLSTYLKYKETDDEGKKKIKYFMTTLAEVEEK